MTDLPYPPPYQDLATLALHLGMTEEAIEKQVQQGKLPKPKMIGNTRRWSWQEVSRFLEAIPPQEPVGLVYVVGFGPYVKIGYTTNLKNRLPTLQTGMPEKLTVYATIMNVAQSEEGRLHKRFSAYRLEGEWFRKEGDVAIWIAAGCPR